MSDKELESVIWCPKCAVEKFSVFRVPTGSSGVFHHITEPPDSAAKVCECGAQLERK